MISVIIPTRGSGDFSKLLQLLKSIERQTLQAEEVLIVIDFDIPKRPILEVIQNSKFKIQNCNVVCQDGYGVCSARNRGVKAAKSEYVLLCDDDVKLQENDILERLLDEYNLKATSYQLPATSHRDPKNTSTVAQPHSNTEAILYPTIMFHSSGKIQSQGFVSYNWLMCRPVPKYGIERKSKFWKWLPLSFLESRPQYGDVQLLGSICFFAKTETLKHSPYDEKFGFIYEDLERSYRAYKKGVALFVSEEIQVEHWEKEKDILAWSYIDKPENVYLKTKHRIRFVLKHATGIQLILFYLIGFWLSNGRTLLYILFYGKRKNKLIQARWRGIMDGLGYEKG